MPLEIATTIWPTDRGGALRKVTSFPAAGVVDGVYNVEIPDPDVPGTNIKLVRTKKGIVNVEEASVYGGVGDMTTQLNGAMANTKLKLLEIHSEAGDITINGTVNAQGKEMIFRTGTKIVGTGTINNAIIFGPFNAQLFASTITLTNCKWGWPWISAKTFGAVGDGVADDIIPLQKVWDYVNSDPKAPRTICWPRGTYKISDSLISYKWDGTDYQFVNMANIAENVGTFTDQQYNTVIQSTHTDKFGVGVERAKTFLMKGFYLKGVADGNLPYSNIYDVASSSYGGYMNGVCRENLTSPYCAFNIDPYTTSVASKPADGGYPGKSIWYRGTGNTGGSTSVNLEDCKLYGWTVGIGLSINGYTQNGESCNFTRVSFGWMKTGIACGHDQLKNNFLYNFIAWDFVHTMFDNTYGAGFGNIPRVLGGCIAGAVNRLFNFFDSGRYPLFCSAIFAENLWQVGIVRGPSLSVLEDCEIDFATTSNPGIGSPDAYLDAENVLVRGGIWRNYDNSRKRLYVKGKNLTFDHVSFQELPVTRINNNIATEQTVTFIDCPLTIAGGIAGANNFQTQSGHGDNAIVLGNNFIVEDPNYFPYGQTIREYNNSTTEGLLVLDTYAITVNTANRTATFNTTVADSRLLQVGEYILKLSGGDLIGRISAIDLVTGLISISETARSLVSGSFRVMMNYVRRVNIPFSGDTTSGSAIITNVEKIGDTFPYPGARIESSLFDTFTVTGNGQAFIKQVDAAARTVTLNINANATKSQVQFINGNPRITVRSTVEPTFSNTFMFAETDWILKSESGTLTRDKHYRFTKPGFTVAATGRPQGEFYEEIYVRLVSNNLQYFDSATNAWKLILSHQSLAAYTANGQATAFTGQDNTVTGATFAKFADLEALRVAYENIRNAVEDIRTKGIATTIYS